MAARAACGCGLAHRTPRHRARFIPPATAPYCGSRAFSMTQTTATAIRRTVTERAVAAIASYSVAYGEKIYPPTASVVCKREDIRDGGVGPRAGRFRHGQHQPAYVAYSPGAAAALHAHGQGGYFVSASGVSAPPYGRRVTPARFAHTQRC